MKNIITLLMITIALIIDLPIFAAHPAATASLSKVQGLEAQERLNNLPLPSLKAQFGGRILTYRQALKEAQSSDDKTQVMNAAYFHTLNETEKEPQKIKEMLKSLLSEVLSTELYQKVKHKIKAMEQIMEINHEKSKHSDFDQEIAKLIEEKKKLEAEMKRIRSEAEEKLRELGLKEKEKLKGLGRSPEEND